MPPERHMAWTYTIVSFVKEPYKTDDKSPIKQTISHLRDIRTRHLFRKSARCMYFLAGVRMQCSVLQCVAACCSAWYVSRYSVCALRALSLVGLERFHVAVCCLRVDISTSHSPSEPCPAFAHCNTLQHTATRCNTLQHIQVRVVCENI